MCCLVYTDNFLYVTILICHIKTNTPVFSANIIVIQKLVNFVHLQEQIEIATQKLSHNNCSCRRGFIDYKNYGNYENLLSC